MFAEAKARGLGALTELLHSCRDRREIRSHDICQYCGKVAGQPHSIIGRIAMAARQGTEYPVPDALYHKHGGSKQDQFDLFDDPLSMEWAYALVPDQDLIEVWAHDRHTRAREKTWRRWIGVKYKAFAVTSTRMSMSLTSGSLNPSLTGRSLRNGA